MKKKKLLKKFEIKKKYNFEYLYKPLMILSVFSVIMYVFKLNGFEYADDLFMFAELSVLLISYFRNCRNINHIQICLSVIFTGIVFYICLYDDVVFLIAEKCRKNGIAFGVTNAVLNTFSLNDLENLIYHTSFGGSKFINGEIITGAVDIFRAKSATSESAMFLCGKYLIMFSIIGIVLSINKHKNEAYLIALAAVLTGNISVFLIMLLFNFTPLYFVALLFVFFCYLISNLALIKSGFYCSGSLIELFIQKENLIYIFAIGIFICAVSYYASRLVKEKLKW